MHISALELRRLLLLICLAGAIWTAVEVELHGFEGAFGGFFARYVSLEPLSPTRDGAAGGVQRLYDKSERRADEWARE